MRKVTMPVLEPDAYSNCDGDYWLEHPADIEFVNGLTVGDEYELTVGINAWTETYRVVKAPDSKHDDYEVERIPNTAHSYITTTQAEAYADARVREALEQVLSMLTGMYTDALKARVPEHEDEEGHNQGCLERALALTDAALQIRAIIKD